MSFLLNRVSGLNYKRRALYVISLIGIAISLYLIFVKFTNAQIQCGLGSCETVQNSSHSELFGVPIAVLGVAFYYILFFLNFNDTRELLKIWSIIGVAFSVYFTYLELFVINAICSWCMVSAGLTALALIICAKRESAALTP